MVYARSAAAVETLLAQPVFAGVAEIILTIVIGARFGIVGRTVTVKVKYADFQIVTRSRTLSESVGTRDMLERTSRELVRTIFPLEKKVRLLGVSLSNLHAREEPRVPPQMTLAL